MTESQTPARQLEQYLRRERLSFEIWNARIPKQTITNTVE
jgi:hypothetical protein